MTMGFEDPNELFDMNKEQLNYALCFTDFACSGMTNGAAIGYAMKAMKSLGYDLDQIRAVEHRMRSTMDLVSEQEAEKFYQEY